MTPLPLPSNPARMPPLRASSLMSPLPPLRHGPPTPLLPRARSQRASLLELRIPASRPTTAPPARPNARRDPADHRSARTGWAAAQHDPDTPCLLGDDPPAPQQEDA